jgi:hypothetical protein
MWLPSSICNRHASTLFQNVFNEISMLTVDAKKEDLLQSQQRPTRVARLVAYATRITQNSDRHPAQPKGTVNRGKVSGAAKAT